MKNKKNLTAVFWMMLLVLTGGALLFSAPKAEASDPGSWDLLDEDFEDITDWTDSDTGTAVSEESPSGQLRLYSGSPAGNYAARRRTLSLDFSFTCEIKVYHDNIGALADNDGFEIAFWSNALDEIVYLGFHSDGLFSFDGAGWDEYEIGTDKPSEDTWQTWRFLVDRSTPGDAMLDAYLNEGSGWVLIEENVPCSVLDTVSDNYLDLYQFGVTTAEQESHVEYLKVATGLYPPCIYTLATTSGQTINVSNNLTIGDGTNEITVTGVTNDPNISVTGNVTVADKATFANSDDSSKTLNIDGNLTINSTTGKFLAPVGTGATSFTLAGNFTNSGTFNNNSGTLTFDGSGASQLVYSASTTFYGLACSTGGKTLQFEETSGVQTIVTNNLTLQGDDCTTGRIFLDSVVDNDAWEIVATGASVDIDYVDVEDSTAITTAITAENSTEDNEGNTNWTVNGGVCSSSTVTISGTVYTDEAKTTPITDGRTVHLFVNSTDYSTTTTSSGDYSFSTVTVAAGDSVIVYLDGVTEDGSVITTALDATTAIADLDIVTAHISLEQRAAVAITNTDLDDIDAVDAGNEDGITISTGNAEFADGFELYILSGETYTPGGTVTCDDFELEGTGSFIPNANAVTVSGDWEMSSSGTFTTSGTTTFDGAAAQSIITGGKSFSALTLNNTGADGTTDNITISGALDVNGTFSVTNGDLYLTTNNPNINTAGDVTIGSSAFVTKGTGTWTFDGGSGTHTLTDSSTAGPQDLGAVAIDNGSTGNVVSTASNIKVTTLNITASDALDISGDTLTIAGSGTPFTQSGTFTTTGSTVIYAGTSATNITVASYNNLTLTPASGSVTYSLAGDLTSGNAMTGNMTISSGATLDSTVSSYDITLTGSWSNAGTYTRNSNIVTFNGTTTGLTISDGGSAFYDLVFSGSGGEWLYADGSSTATNSTSVSAGTPTLLNVKAGTVSVTGGTLNVDWYLGTHAVNAANTGTNIDTGDADITISEANSASAVWRHNGTSWGSAAISQTTGTAATGINPQPNSDGALRIREYSMTDSATCPGVGCTLYKYNEQVDWVSTYGEYDYYDDYGENYITSCWAGSTSACSDDTADDDTIGVGWYRSTIGTINTPYDTVNTPPTQGSWYVGMMESIDFDIDTFTRDFGTITPGGNPTDLTNTLTVTTSASHGYVVYARSEQPMTCSESAVCGTADIDDWTGTNEIPTTWSAGNYGFGYSTNDYALEAGDGDADRFSGPLFAGFTDLGFGDPVADRSGPSSAQQNVITYRISASGIQNAGSYQASIYYVVAPTY